MFICKAVAKWCDRIRQILQAFGSSLQPDDTVRYRPATKRDAREIGRLYDIGVRAGAFLGFGKRPSAEVFESAISSGMLAVKVRETILHLRAQVFVAVVQDHIVGMAVAKQWVEPDQSGQPAASDVNTELWLLAVDKPFRRRGIGLGLIDYQLATALRLNPQLKRAFARCTPSSAEAHQLFRKRGFFQHLPFEQGIKFELVLREDR